MLVGGAVATQRGAALLAGAQVDPLRAQLHALGALPPLGVPHGGDLSEMSAASVGHGRPRLWDHDHRVRDPGDYLKWRSGASEVGRSEERRVGKEGGERVW